MQTKRVPANEIVGKDWFSRIFKREPELADIVIASGKENFGRCTKCTELENDLRAERSAANPDVDKITKIKERRIHHLMLQRADKISYYANRDRAREDGTDIISVIVDKMDGNKNKCPRCAPLPAPFVFGFCPAR